MSDRSRTSNGIDERTEEKINIVKTMERNLVLLKAYSQEPEKYPIVEMMYTYRSVCKAVLDFGRDDNLRDMNLQEKKVFLDKTLALKERLSMIIEEIRDLLTMEDDVEVWIKEKKSKMRVKGGEVKWMKGGGGDDENGRR